jgi:hypothetical protein
MIMSFDMGDVPSKEGLWRFGRREIFADSHAVPGKRASRGSSMRCDNLGSPTLSGLPRLAKALAACRRLT